MDEVYDWQRQDPPPDSDWLCLVTTGGRQRSSIFLRMSIQCHNIVTVSTDIYMFSVSAAFIAFESLSKAG